MSQSISSIWAYICFQKTSDLLLSFFMRWYIDIQSFFLMRLKLLLTKSRAFETQACWFQSCFSCPGTSDKQRNPSIISLYQSRSSLSKASRISLGVRRFQWMRSEFSMQSDWLFLGLQIWRTRIGILMGKVIRFLDYKLGGRMRKMRSYRSSRLLFRRIRSLKLATFWGCLQPKLSRVVRGKLRPSELCNLIILPYLIIELRNIHLFLVVSPTHQIPHKSPPFDLCLTHQQYFDNFYLKRKKMAEHLHFLSDMGKLAELKYKKRPIIAEFFTEWCPPCKPTRAILQKELRQGGGKFSLACINCDEAEELNIEYQIEGVPTIIALNWDEKLTVFDKVVGYDAKKIKDFMQRVKKELIERKN